MSVLKRGKGIDNKMHVHHGHVCSLIVKTSQPLAVDCIREGVNLVRETKKVKDELLECFNSPNKVRDPSKLVFIQLLLG